MNNDMNYEKAVERLEEIVSELEKNEVSLDKALALFEEGTSLTKYCSKLLSEAKQKITEISKD